MGLVSRLREIAVEYEEAAEFGRKNNMGKAADQHFLAAKLLRTDVVSLEALLRAVEPFVAASQIIDRYASHWPDEQPFKSGLAWTQRSDGATRTLTNGDLRALALAAQAVKGA